VTIEFVASAYRLRAAIGNEQAGKSARHDFARQQKFKYGSH